MDVNENAGRVVLWIGNECAAWTPEQFGEAAAWARSLGIDTISPKRANGTAKWYRNADILKAERAAVLAQGCGYLPFTYLYAEGYQEMGPVQEMLGVNGSAMIDAEVEYNGNPQVAHDEGFSIGMPDSLLYLTSWANPHAQNWDAVLRAWLPYIACYVPQQYNDHLASDEPQVIADSGGKTIQVGTDLSQEFGANHQLAIAKQALADGHQTLWLWEYQVARQQPDLVRQLVAVMHSQPVEKRIYIVKSGDYLWGIIHELGLNISAAQLAAENANLWAPGPVNPNHIEPGWEIRY